MYKYRFVRDGCSSRGLEILQLHSVYMQPKGMYRECEIRTLPAMPMTA